MSDELEKAKDLGIPRKTNNCPCILCHIGRNAGYRDSNSNYAPLENVMSAIQGYDLSQSPYPFTEDDRQAMIAYISGNKEDNGTLHFENLAYFFEERGDND